MRGWRAALWIPANSPSFPRKRESRWLQSSPLFEIKYESRATNPFSIYGLAGEGLAV